MPSPPLAFLGGCRRQESVQAMDASNRDEPIEAFWYVFGRIAEQHGERAVASAIYQRVTRPKYPEAIPLSSSSPSISRALPLRGVRGRHGSCPGRWPRRGEIALPTRRRDLSA